MCSTEGCKNKANDKRGKCYKCLGYRSKCQTCKKKQAQKEGYCYGCHPNGKCKTCHKNIAFLLLQKNE